MDLYYSYSNISTVPRICFLSFWFEQRERFYRFSLLFTLTLCVISLCMLLQGSLRRRGSGRPVKNIHCLLNYVAEHSRRHPPRLFTHIHTHTHQHVPVEVMVACHSTLTAYGWEGKVLIEPHKVIIEHQ